MFLKCLTAIAKGDKVALKTVTREDKTILDTVHSFNEQSGSVTEVFTALHLIELIIENQSYKKIQKKLKII